MIVRYIGGVMAVMGLGGFLQFVDAGLFPYADALFQIIFVVIFGLIILIVYKAQKDPKKFGSMPMTFPMVNRNPEKKNVIKFSIFTLLVIVLTILTVLNPDSPAEDMPTMRIFIAGWGLITIYGSSLYFQLLIPRNY